MKRALAAGLSAGDAREAAFELSAAEIEKTDDPTVLAAYGGCADALRGPLEDRLAKGDDPSSSAGQVLLHAGVVDGDAYVDFALDGDLRPGYRALGARGLLGEDHGELRRKLMLDVDERVRVGAVKAALLLPIEDDLEALIEAARVDPNREVRLTATRAIGRIGGPRGVAALSDLWVHAEPRQREAVVDGWMSAASFDVGGRHMLEKASETSAPGSVAAALALARQNAETGPTEASRRTALGVLVRVIKLGTHEDRTFAMLMSPNEPVILEALRVATEDSDQGIQLIALGRIARDGSPAEAQAARDKLLAIAESDAQERVRAMGELTNLEDRRVLPSLKKEILAEAPFSRAFAARQLWRWREYETAAAALVDADPTVRRGASCSFLEENN